MKAYYAAIIPDEGQYSVIFPDLPGCQTWGGSPEEAFGRAVDALAGHLEALADDGDPIPEAGDLKEAEKGFRAFCREMELDMPKGVLMQMVPAPELDLTPVRVSVSFKRSTLEMIDRKAEASGLTRSGFLAQAAVTAGQERPKRSAR